MDATKRDDPPIEDRRSGLLSRVESEDGTIIVCVPSRFQRENPDLLVPLPQVADLWYVGADGSWKPSRNDSFVADSSLNKRGESTDKNELKLLPLP